MAYLVVVDGDHRRRVQVTAATVVVGRAPECDVVLAGDDTVSRRHAQLTHTGTEWVVTDMGSRNGTHVNGRRISTPTALSRQDRVRVGEFVLLTGTDSDEDLETTDGSGRHPRLHQAGAGLSAREIDVVRLVCAGLADQAIAEELFVSIKTVHSHLDRIGQKTGHRRRPELVRFGIEHGLA